MFDPNREEKLVCHSLFWPEKPMTSQLVLAMWVNNGDPLRKQQSWGPIRELLRSHPEGLGLAREF